MSGWNARPKTPCACLIGSAPAMCRSTGAPAGHWFGQIRDAVYFHGESGLGWAELPATTRTVGQYKGPAAMVRAAIERPGEVTLVAVGPLTNVAIALNVEPNLPKLLKRLVIMGGAYRVPGNTVPWAEFNILADPEAAAQVFAAPWNDCLAVGLDVSHQVEVSKDVWEQSRGARSRRRPGAGAGGQANIR